MRTSFVLSFALALVGAFGCDGTSTVDGGLLDVPVEPDTAPPVDAPLPLDVPAIPDAPVSDAPVVTDAPVVADAPVPPFDGGACEYTGLDEVIVLCRDAYTFVSRIGVFPASAECPEFYVVGTDTDRYASTAEAIAGESCDPTCQWRFSMSVSRVYCGVRSGYESLRAEGCPDVYRFSEGYYPSVEAHDAAHPCP